MKGVPTIRSNAAGRVGTRATAAVAAALILASCAAPGSAMTQVGISGRVVDAAGAPVSGEQIEVLLPPSYGLAGLDSVMGEPSDYGHRPLRASITTDAEGRFSHLFPGTTYSIAFWLVPPLGALPRKPPQPTVAVRTPSIAPNWVLVRSTDDGIESRLFEEATKTVKADPEARVTGSSTFVDPPDAERESQGFRGWRLDATIRRP